MATPAVRDACRTSRTAEINTVRLKLKNKITDDENVALNNTRATRDLEMYAPQTGMVDVALAIKNYVKAAFNTNSTQYKQISGIEFRNVS